MTQRCKLILLFMLFAIQAQGIDKNGFVVYVIEHKDLSCPGVNYKFTNAKLLFDQNDVESLNWTDQTFHLTMAATKKLVRNATELEDESNESFVPLGEFPDAEGKAFIMVLSGKPILSGFVAGMKTLQHPPDCSLLYPYLPMTEKGKLIIGVGHPRSDEELRESFFKVLIEEGPASCFKPALDEIVRQYFANQKE